MKSFSSQAVILCLVLSALPRDVRKQPIRSAPLQGHLSDARRVVRRSGRSVEELKGVLISDVEAKSVRFIGNAQASFEVAYDRIEALHYEMDTIQTRALPGALQTAHYLTIFYSNTAGQGNVATFRLPAGDAASVLDSLETDMRVRVNRTLPKRSFLGLPIRLAVGDEIVVTDRTGQMASGPIIHMSASSIVIGSTPAEREFGETSVRRISLTRPDSRPAPPTAKWWAGIGAVVGGFYGGAFGGVTGMLEGAAVAGAVWGVIGAGVNAMSAAQADVDVYIGPP